MKTYTAYYRVSTQKQGQSGLGLEAQQFSVNSFIQGKGTLVAEFVEVESGKKDNRPELAKAIAHAKATGSTLVIAKLDRLSRNAGFIFALRDSGVDFIAADLPEANTLTIGIFAVMAQHERETISKRTKDALQAKKAQGFTLGNPANLTNEGRLNSLKIRQTNALEDKANVQATELATMYNEKGMKLQQIADKLNEKGFTTRRGKAFAPTTVKRLLDRHEQLNQPQKLKSFNKTAMKRFSELLEENEPEVSKLACQYCDNQIKYFGEEKWLQWARDRFEEEDLLKLEGLKLKKYWLPYQKNFTYDTFIDHVNRACMAFYRVNGGKPTKAEQRFFAKMQSESGFTPANLKEPADTSEDKIQVILDKGVVYVDKAKTFVLSQF